MSVLLTGLSPELTEAVAERLQGQGDEVRMIVANDAERERWRPRGVHVAVGDLTDDDFLWRACTNVRTVVAGDHAPVSSREVREVLAAMLTKTDVDRLVVVGAGKPDELVTGAEAAGLSYVVLRFRKKGLLGTKDAVAPRDLATAIDAADDLAGEPHLDLDLTDGAAWTSLLLEPPR